MSPIGAMTDPLEPSMGAPRPQDSGLPGINDDNVLLDDVPPPADIAEEAEPSFYDQPDEDLSRPGGRTADVLRAQARVSRHLAIEQSADKELEDTLRTFVQSEASGTITIFRRGPPGMPACEYGRVCDISCADVRTKSLEERVEARAGGGEYRAVFRRGDSSLASVPPMTFEIAGDPIPKSTIGRRWLKDAQRDGMEQRPDRSDDLLDGRGGMVQVMLKFFGDQTAAREAAEDRARRDHAAAMERERTEAITEREAARAQAQADREAAKAAADLERERIREEMKTAAQMQKEQFAANMELVKMRAEAELEAIRQRGAVELERAKSDIKMHERSSEMKMTGGLGFDVLADVKKGIAEMFMKKSEKDMGFEDDETPWYVDILKDNAPALLQMGQELLLGKSSAPPPPAPTVPSLVHTTPRALPEHADAPNDDVPTVEDAPEAEESQQAAPSTPELAQVLQANDAVGGRLAVAAVVGFVRPLAAVMRLGPEPETAWDMPLSAEGDTLAQCYGRMPGNARAALATGWDQFLPLIAGLKQEHALLTHLMTVPENRAWMDALLSVGPWTPEEAPANE